MSEYKIGDRVVIRAYKNVPVESRTKGMARLSGKKGTIVDKLFSQHFDGFVYTIKFDDFDIPSKKMWTEDMFYILLEIPVEYRYEFDILDNVVVARFFEIKGETKTEIEIGHGHIIHEGARGIAQASSYALKKIFEKMNGGTLE